MNTAVPLAVYVYILFFVVTTHVGKYYGLLLYHMARSMHRQIGLMYAEPYVGQK